MFGVWRRVDNLSSLDDLGANAIDFKGLFTLDDVDELVAFFVLMQREPEAGRPFRSIDDGFLTGQVDQVGLKNLFGDISRHLRMDHFRRSEPQNGSSK